MHSPGPFSSLTRCNIGAAALHADSFSDLADAVAADFGRVAARVERAVLSLDDVARVHLYRWGDGGARFHVWFLPRPLGMLEARGMMLPVWEDVLPTCPTTRSGQLRSG